jgi:nickel-dependent lactate racemase
MSDVRLTSIELAYGRVGLAIQSPADRTTVVAPRPAEPAADPAAALRAALRHPVSGPPLRQVVPAGARVAVSLCDATRPQPREAMIRVLLDELDDIVARDDVLLLVATGTHRGNTDLELRAMLGDELVETVRILNHDGRDNQMLSWCGTYGAGVRCGSIVIGWTRTSG